MDVHWPAVSFVSAHLQAKTKKENILYESTKQLSSKTYTVILCASLVFNNLLPYPVTCKLQVTASVHFITALASF